MPAAALRGEFESSHEQIASLRTTGRVRVIGRQGHEFRGGLEEDIGELQSAVAELAREFPGELTQRWEDARRPQVRPPLEQADVHAVESKHGDEVQHLVVRQQWKGEI